MWLISICNYTLTVTNGIFMHYCSDTLFCRWRYESHVFRSYFWRSAISAITFILHSLHFLSSLVRGHWFFFIRCPKLNLVFFHLSKGTCLCSIGLHFPIWCFWFSLARDKGLVFVYLWTKQNKTKPNLVSCYCLYLKSSKCKPVCRKSGNCTWCDKIINYLLNNISHSDSISYISFFGKNNYKLWDFFS